MATLQRHILAAVVQQSCRQLGLPCLHGTLRCLGQAVSQAVGPGWHHPRGPTAASVAAAAARLADQANVGRGVAACSLSMGRLDKPNDDAAPTPPPPPAPSSSSPPSPRRAAILL